MVVKQGPATYGQIMCCTNTATTNNIGDKIEYRCGEVKVGMSVLMGNIAAIGQTGTHKYLEITLNRQSGNTIPRRSSDHRPETSN